MLESVGPLGYVIRKLNQVFASGDTSSARLEVIEIIEALILALVAVATAWSGYQAAAWAGRRAEDYSKASRVRVTAEGWLRWQARSESTTAIPLIVGSLPGLMARSKQPSFSSDAFATSIACIRGLDEDRSIKCRIGRKATDIPNLHNALGDIGHARSNHR